ncbi:pseudaminic acid synthase [Sinorhizobium fredii]|uniref:pseudaminic acid synthase n=1 Tax=Rhizobium fredii TaxID=380 RepID=UPI001294DE2D|nr:pseudaminic acid synthase [Sinorhizobium fredii]MQW93941.1 pseudaminic acid synthase [Sinorhizobium fredii]UTY46207.1 pseudaminic acid synthase [Sinorhizobium fredii]
MVRSRHGKTFIIAELSANHGGSLETAIASVHAAAEAGADAVKLQTYTADTLTIDCSSEIFQIKQGTLWDGQTLYSLYSEAYTPWEWHEPIRNATLSAGMEFLSTPFDPSAVEFLESLNVNLYKIASFEIVDIPLIKLVAAKKKPMLMSTGIADLATIDEAVRACRSVGNNDITLLKCTSAYPAPPEDANLATIPNMASTFGVEVGLSDHTIGHAVAVTAVALGATVVEKHFIIDRSIGGPDASFSMEPAEFRQMVDAIRTAERAMGSVDYSVQGASAKNRKFSRSLFVVEDVNEGEELTYYNVRSIRPGDGLHPRYLDEVVGLRASRSIRRGTPLDWSLVLR